MTENKRFTIGILKTFVNDNEKNYCYSLELPSEANHLCDLLNELHEENQDCENEIARLQLINNKLKDKDYTNYKKKIQELQEKNKELSEQVEYLKKQVKIFRGECNRLTKENTELLKELND